MEVIKYPDGSRITKDNYGTYHYDKNNKLHNDNGPAVEYHTDGNQQWFKHGKKHKLDGPADIIPGKYGRECYYIDGKWFHPNDYFNIIEFLFMI